MKLPHIIQKHGKAFTKYAIVGVAGTVIDVGLFTVLIAMTPLGFTSLGHTAAASISFVLAVINNYYWNSKWTFAAETSKASNKRFAKFFFVSCIGFVLNLMFLSIFASILSIAFVTMLTLDLTIAKVGASGCVLIYNFIANRFWTFKA